MHLVAGAGLYRNTKGEDIYWPCVSTVFLGGHVVTDKDKRQLMTY